ncbi:DUF72 domain-containing protein [Variovorax ginsengisoli]|uniref:Uncharacterized protein YecE (DUF72 family) n=1 Tax=Variovorax ginsengisoli TaxID=363844 RepID=A0ABT9SBM0_9BURK|nr:DUF72 domain-containing protein [Variovorax ginsengisoli]MDP9901738.1 uncharacterized protein YecE (DUF72 family) [Variovorax ginsengisoli]
MQDSLFDDLDPLPPPTPAPAPSPEGKAAPRARRATAARETLVTAVAPDPALQQIAAGLPARLHMGSSSWHFPGWAGLVWEGDYEQSVLSRHGLPAYAQHPLLRAVGIDRTFYRPLTASQFARYAAQVPDDFRFVVKAPSVVADAMVRDENGRGMQPNPVFLDPLLAVQQFVQPALDGLGHKLGALVFQLSPLPVPMLARLPEVLERLRTLLCALPALAPTAPDAVTAVEVRNPEFLTPAFVDVLREAGATYCLGLHPKLPPIEAQLPLLRALWPGPLVCRWNLNRLHGAYGYEDARALYLPFDQVVDPDPDTRAVLARVIDATTRAGQHAYVTVSNKAEGSAPLTVRSLAQALERRQEMPAPERR